MCELCNDSGFIPYTDDRGYVFVKPCVCREKMLTDIRMRASGISDAFQKKSIDEFDTKGNKDLETAKLKATEYVDNFTEIEHTKINSIMYLGNPGCGKTHLSLAIGNKLLNEYGVGCLYMPYRETMTELKQLNRGEDKLKYDQKMHKLSTVRLLIMDDLFKGTVTEADLNYIFQIVNQRYLNELPFIVSSEKSPTDLLAIDEAIGSRLLEQAKGNIVHIKDKSLNYRIYK